MECMNGMNAMPRNEEDEEEEDEEQCECDEEHDECFQRVLGVVCVRSGKMNVAAYLYAMSQRVNAHNDSS